MKTICVLTARLHERAVKLMCNQRQFPHSIMALRGCFSVTTYEDHAKVLEWIPPKSSELGHFIGNLAMWGEFQMDILSTINKNITWYESDVSSYEKMTNNKYTGCLGRLQDNSSDITLFQWDVKHVRPGLGFGKIIFTTPQTSLISSYDPAVRVKKTELMNTIQSVSIEVWIGLVFLSLFISLMMTIGVYVMKREERTFGKLFIRTTSNLITHMVKLLIDQPSESRYASHDSTFKIMVLSVILLAFYSSFFITTMIKTTAVTLDRPKTIENYDDIINSNVRPLFDSSTGTHLPFKNAAKGSKKRPECSSSIVL